MADLRSSRNAVSRKIAAMNRRETLEIQGSASQFVGEESKMLDRAEIGSIDSETDQLILSDR